MGRDNGKSFCKKGNAGGRKGNEVQSYVVIVIFEHSQWEEISIRAFAKEETLEGGKEMEYSHVL